MSFCHHHGVMVHVLYEYMVMIWLNFQKSMLTSTLLLRAGNMYWCWTPAVTHVAHVNVTAHADHVSSGQALKPLLGHQYHHH